LERVGRLGQATGKFERAVSWGGIVTLNPGLFELFDDRAVMVSLSPPAVYSSVPVKTGRRLKPFGRIVQDEGAEIERKTHETLKQGEKVKRERGEKGLRLFFSFYPFPLLPISPFPLYDPFFP